MACISENDSNFTVMIPSYETKDNVTYYVIKVTVGRISWTVTHRYKDFAELHSTLVNEHCVTKELLPQKKLIGNRDPNFIENRKMSLEIYLHTVLKHLQRAMPKRLLTFLDFENYDITYILQNMASEFYKNGDKVLQKSPEYSFNPLQLHAISERLQKCCFPSEVCNSAYDFSHILDFCGKLKTIYIRGGRTNVGTSNIMLNNLSFDLTIFKSLENLFCYNVHLNNITDFGSLRRTLTGLTVYNSGVKQLADVLLCDRIHKTCENVEDTWPNLKKIDLSWNELTRFDDTITLAPNLQSITIDGNTVRRIENTESLLNLSHLCMSANSLLVEGSLINKLKNIVHLNLSQNKITKLSPFSELILLKDLDLRSNLIAEASEMKYVCTLPNLEYLVLTGNPVSTIIDYRIKVFESFGDRAKYLCLDNERPSQQELDTAAVLRALAVVRNGKSPIASRQ